MTRLSLAGQVVQQPRPPQGVLLLAVLLVLVGGGYWVTSHAGGHRAAAATQPSPVSPPACAPADAAADEDVANHLRHAQEALIHIQEASRRIDQRLNQVSPVLDANFLRLERQRIDAADQLSNSTLRDAAEALDELQLTQQSLQTRRK